MQAVSLPNHFIISFVIICEYFMFCMIVSSVLQSEETFKKLKRHATALQSHFVWRDLILFTKLKCHF